MFFDAAMTDTLEEALFSSIVNDTQQQTPQDGPTQLFDMGADDPSPELAGSAGDMLDEALAAPLQDDADETPDILDGDPLEPRLQDGGMVDSPFSTQGQSVEALDRAVSGLSSSLRPRTTQELVDQVSRGAPGANLDPYGDRLRETIRSIMRREA